MAANVTVTPSRPSSAWNRRMNSTSPTPSRMREHVGHALAHRKRLALNLQVREHRRALHDVLERDQHFLQRDLGQDAHDLPVRELGDRGVDVALEPRQAVDVLGRLLVALVFLQPAHELGARVLFLFATLRHAAAGASGT